MKTVRASIIAEKFGFTSRHWIRQAANGNIPGAYQPSGPGGQWLFDIHAFEKWFNSKVRGVQTWRAPTKEGTSGGAASKKMVSNTELPLRHELKQLLKNVSERGLTNSKPNNGAANVVTLSERSPRHS